MDHHTLISQLGGNKFIVMTGANNFTRVDGNTLSFRLPHSIINHVQIKLNAMDTYDMEFCQIRGVKCKVVETVEDVYNDSLQDVFTRVTGLSTRL